MFSLLILRITNSFERGSRDVFLRGGQHFHTCTVFATVLRFHRNKFERRVPMQEFLNLSNTFSGCCDHFQIRREFDGGPLSLEVVSDLLIPSFSNGNPYRNNQTLVAKVLNVFLAVR